LKSEKNKKKYPMNSAMIQIPTQAFVKIVANTTYPMMTNSG